MKVVLDTQMTMTTLSIFIYKNQTREIAWSKVSEVVSTDGKLNWVSLGCEAVGEKIEREAP